ncbi:MAG: hypothetical protein NTW86_32760 [Candidatus Sumerlaeota bacterium]|nr:hypothetical protein [Candidatus Sumerlaeota bacterium]
MLETIWAVVHGGRIEPVEPVALPERMRVLVTPLPEEDAREFWSKASEQALAKVWGNAEDDVYAQLL